MHILSHLSSRSLPFSTSTDSLVCAGRRDMVDAAEAPPDAVAGAQAVAEAEGLRRELAKAVAAQTSLAKALQQAWAREEAAELQRVGPRAELSSSVPTAPARSDTISAEDAGTLAAAVASTEASLVTESA